MNQNEIMLPIFTAFLLFFGFVVLSSAAPDDAYLRQQLIYLVSALLLCLVLFFVGMWRVIPLVYPAYVVVNVLLLLTLLFGREINGARRWLDLGFFSFQPSELMKIVLIVVLAMNFGKASQGWIPLLRVAVLLLIPTMLVALGPDLGTALVLVAVAVGMLLIRGIPTKLLVAAVVSLVLVVPTIVLPNLKPHQQARIQSFVNPLSDPQGSGYQVIQARIAIGSAGVWGKGHRQGTQSQFGFIPFRHTDFIFPVLTEEWGFVGAMALMLLYSLLFWRLAVMAAECMRLCDQLIIVGVLLLMSFQTLVNIGVTMGLAPVTGITLPFVSYGGTSLLSNLIALALAYTVHRERYQEAPLF